MVSKSALQARNKQLSRQPAYERAPVTVVASGELSVVHQKMHRLSRNACEADTSRKTCARPSRRSLSA